VPSKTTSKPAAIELLVEIGSTVFVLGTVSFNLQKEELSYHLIASEEAPEQAIDVSSGTIGDRLHHITWHAKRAHIRTYSKIVQETNYPWEGLLTTDGLVPRLLLVEGVRLKNSTKLLRRYERHKSWTGSSQEFILRQDSVDDFSVIFFLVPKDIPTTDLIGRGVCVDLRGVEFPLWYLRSERGEVGRIRAFLKWDLVILATPFAQSADPVHRTFQTGYRSLDFIKPENSLLAIAHKAKRSPSLTAVQIEALRCVGQQSTNHLISEYVHSRIFSPIS
jgi:hypothetical protein